jgi:hypothetical protein
MGHSQNYFELEKGFNWPLNSRLLANTFSSKQMKLIAAIWCIMAAIAFVLSGIIVLFNHSWQSLLTIIAVILSTMLFIVFWDGKRNKLHTQGSIGIFINMIVLAYTIFL